jgi:photosystem II stability/assembly factor-like uncharacterized protein
MAVGWNGTIARTDDGGITWVLQASGTSSDLSAFTMLNSDSGTAVGYPTVILRTTDGGLTWFEQLSGTDRVLTDVSFADANTGLIAGASPIGEAGILLRTTNGGTTWIEQSTGQSASWTSVQFIDPNTAVIVGNGGTILRSTNAGQSWFPQPSGTTEDFSSVSFSSVNTGVIVGTGNLYRTTNGGQTWTVTNLSTPNDLLHVWLHASGRGIVVGENGTMYRTGNSGTTWSLVSSGSSIPLNGISFADENIGVGVGQGTLFRTTNAGTSWTSSTLTGNLGDVDFANESVGTIVGGSGLEGIAWRTTDAGVTWVNQSPSESSLGEIQYVNSNTGTILGSNGTILRTTDAGLTWSSQPSGTSMSLSGVFFTDVNTGVVVGGDLPSSSVILRTTNGGSTWTPQSSPTTQPLKDVAFVNQSIGVAVGWAGTILRTTDGGSTWVNQVSGTSSILYGIGFDVSGTVGIAVGSGGTVLRTDDFGVTWTIEQVGTFADLYCVASLVQGGCTIGGVGGTILYSPLTAIPLTGITIDVEIDSLDKFVPAVGDTFTYQITLENQTSEQQTVDVWTKVLRPIGDPIDPLYGPQSVTLPPLTMVVIDTPELPVPYNAVEGDYSLVGFVGTYQSDTLHSDTTAFVKLQQIPCDSIDQFQARCRSGGTIQARIVLLNSTEYAGEQIIIGIDGVNYPLTIITNGTHSKAQTVLSGQLLGSHTVTLVSPTGCFDPVTVTCTNVFSEGDEWWWEGGDFLAEFELREDRLVRTALNGNYPNPANPATTISYQISDDILVSLKVYDILGREVATLVDAKELAGYHEVNFDAKDLASGLYFYRLKAGSFSEVRKLLVMK